MNSVSRALAIYYYFNKTYGFDKKKFLEKTGIPNRSFHNWQKHLVADINDKSKLLINIGLSIDAHIWTDNFNSERYMLSVIDTYIDKNAKSKNEDLKPFVFDEENENYRSNEDEILKVLTDENSIQFKNLDFQKYSPKLLFELSKVLLNKNQPSEAIEVISILKKDNSLFKFVHQFEINHHLAICYSHNFIQEYNKAIDLLSYLMYADYYQKNIEVITLLASNYKRRALSSSDGGLCDIEEIDSNLLLKSLTLYNKSFQHRKDSKYYDAINILYLQKLLDITDSLTYGRLNDTNLNKPIDPEIFNIKANSWWEMITLVEYNMFLGDSKKAIKLLDDFFAYGNSPIPFEVNTSLRQIRLYYHFTKDITAKSIIKYMENIASCFSHSK